MNAPPRRDNGLSAQAIVGADQSRLPDQDITARRHAQLPAPGSIKRQVLDVLLDGQSLTSLDAWRRFGTSRLAGLIHQLRCEGWDIHAENIAVTTAADRTAHVARYALIGRHDAP